VARDFRRVEFNPHAHVPRDWRKRSSKSIDHNRLRVSGSVDVAKVTTAARGETFDGCVPPTAKAEAERTEKARIAKLEAHILKSEDALAKYNEQLVVEANRSNLAQINELSRKISQVKQEIEDLYREYAG